MMKITRITFIGSLKLTVMLVMAISFILTSTGCKKEGCTDSTATNYDSEADTDDGSCIILGCTDPEAANYNPNATISSGNCVYSRDAMIGTYVGSGSIVCNISGSAEATGLNIVITPSSVSLSKILVSIDGQILLTATVSGVNITFDNQTVNGFTYSGSGSVVGETLTINLTEEDPMIPETCTYTVTGPRQ